MLLKRSPFHRQVELMLCQPGRPLHTYESLEVVVAVPIDVAVERMESGADTNAQMMHRKAMEQIVERMGIRYC